MNQGLVDAWRTIYSREGWRAFSRGYLPNLIGVSAFIKMLSTGVFHNIFQIVPYAGTELAVYEVSVE